MAFAGVKVIPHLSKVGAMPRRQSLRAAAAEGEDAPGARWTSGVRAVVPGFAVLPVIALTSAQRESSS